MAIDVTATHIPPNILTDRRKKAGSSVVMFMEQSTITLGRSSAADELLNPKATDRGITANIGVIYNQKITINIGYTLGYAVGRVGRRSIIINEFYSTEKSMN